MRVNFFLHLAQKRYTKHHLVWYSLFPNLQLLHMVPERIFACRQDCYLPVLAILKVCPARAPVCSAMIRVFFLKNSSISATMYAPEIDSGVQHNLS